MDDPRSDAARLAPPPEVATTVPHLVQFYERETFLLDRAAEFLGPGLARGEAALVIAPRAHRDGLEARLKAGRSDIAAAAREGRYVTLDAAATGFVAGGSPDAGRIAAVIGGALARARAKARAPRVRAFDEMGTLLVESGKLDAAARVESVWNELVRGHPLSVLCGYPLRAFREPARTRSFAEIVSAHARVLPTESYSALTDADERLRTIAALQQRAAALETEGAARRAADRTLRLREAELADFLENAVEGVRQVGPDGTILWANRTELELLGFALQEYVGRSVVEFHVDRNEVEDLQRRVRAGETLVDHPALLRCKDGSTRQVLINAKGYSTGGQFVYWRAFTRDVTERVALEERVQGQIGLAKTDPRATGA